MLLFIKLTLMRKWSYLSAKLRLNVSDFPSWWCRGILLRNACVRAFRELCMSWKLFSTENHSNLIFYKVIIPYYYSLHKRKGRLALIKVNLKIYRLLVRKLHMGFLEPAWAWLLLLFFFNPHHLLLIERQQTVRKDLKTEFKFKLKDVSTMQARWSSLFQLF